MSERLTEKMKRYNFLQGEIEAAYHEAALKFGLSDSSVLVLYTICSSGDSCLVGDISRLSGVSKQTINSALRRLEAEGILYLEAAERKRKRVCLTKKGQELAERTVVRLMQIENEIFDSWTEQESEQYLTLTHRYYTALKEKIKEVPYSDEHSVIGSL